MRIVVVYTKFFYLITYIFSYSIKFADLQVFDLPVISIETVKKMVKYAAHIILSIMAILNK